MRGISLRLRRIGKKPKTRESKSRRGKQKKPSALKRKSAKCKLRKSEVMPS